MNSAKQARKISIHSLLFVVDFLQGVLNNVWSTTKLINGRLWLSNPLKTVNKLE
jgi:hypothetical protein